MTNQTDISGMDLYNQQMTQNSAWQQYYQKDIPQDTGITSPEGHTVLPFPEPPYVLTAAEMDKYGTAPAYLNPSGMLYRSGSENRVLLSASAPQCGPPNGRCLPPIHKPDPRALQVKPLYKQSTFRPKEGTQLPTAYNVVGMY